MCVLLVQFSSVPWPGWSSGGHEGQFSRDALPIFSASSHCQRFWHGQGCPLLDVVPPAFSLPTMMSSASPFPLQVSCMMVLERLLWYVVRDMPNSSLQRFPKRSSSSRPWLGSPINVASLSQSKKSISVSFVVMHSVRQWCLLST